MSQTISSGTLSSLNVSGVGDIVSVTGTGILAGATISSGGTVLVSGGGITIHDVIGSNGRQIIGSGGLAVSGTVTQTGLVTVSSGGIESGGTLALFSNEVVSAGGTAIGTKLVAQAILSISSGGIASGAIASAMFSAVDVWSGGTAIDGVDTNYGTDSIHLGGIGRNETVSATGLELVRGGTASGTRVLSGGTQIVEGGGSNLSATILAGGTQIVSLGITRNDTIDGVQRVLAGGQAVNDTVGSGGSELVSAGGIQTNTTISGGTDFLSAGAIEVGGITFAGSGGDLVIGSGGFVTAPIHGFVTGADDKINLRGFGTGTTATVIAPDTVFIASCGSALTLDIEGAVIGERFAVVADPSGGVDIVPCFLEGTHVLTRSGEKRIEELAVGDLVMTRGIAGIPVEQPVVWIGRRSLKAADLPAGERHPVRIRSGAFGNGLPHRDLLVTQEHCVFVRGKLVPARMLVNGRSIVTDPTIGAYTIYHLELARHEVVFAEGLTMESYLDTGNRMNFQNADGVALRPDFSLNPQSPLWNSAAAPLAVDREFVEPIWIELDQRAIGLGFACTTPTMRLTSDPELHLLLDGGLRVEALAVRGNRHLFVVPRNTSTVRLASRAARPSDVVGPYLDDRRSLGVMVGEIVGQVGRYRSQETAHLSRRTVDGWFAIESERARWTNGNALLPIDLSAARHKSMLLEIEIVHCGPYPQSGRTQAPGSLGN